MICDHYIPQILRYRYWIKEYQGTFAFKTFCCMVDIGKSGMGYWAPDRDGAIHHAARSLADQHKPDIILLQRVKEDEIAAEGL